MTKRKVVYAGTYPESRLPGKIHEIHIDNNQEYIPPSQTPGYREKLEQFEERNKEKYEQKLQKHISNKKSHPSFDKWLYDNYRIDKIDYKYLPSSSMKEYQSRYKIYLHGIYGIDY